MDQTQIDQALNSVSIAASEQQTKARPHCIAEWAKWLKLETYADTQLEAMVAACARWCSRFKAWEQGQSNPCWISLLGKTGVGKTHCAKRLWNWSRDRVRWVWLEYTEHLIYWPALIRDLRGENRGDYFGLLRDAASWPVLMLDDIGAERDTTGFAAEQLNTLLGCRVGKWTIITSNLQLDQLAQIDPRIADRIIREPGNEVVDVDTITHALRGTRA